MISLATAEWSLGIFPSTVDSPPPRPLGQVTSPPPYGDLLHSLFGSVEPHELVSDLPGITVQGTWRSAASFRPNSSDRQITASISVSDLTLASLRSARDLVDHVYREILTQISREVEQVYFDRMRGLAQGVGASVSPLSYSRIVCSPDRYYDLMQSHTVLYMRDRIFPSPRIGDGVCYGHRGPPPVFAFSAPEVRMFRAEDVRTVEIYVRVFLDVDMSHTGVYNIPTGD